MKEYSHLFEDRISKSFKDISRTNEMISKFLRNDFQEQIKAAFKITDHTKMLREIFKPATTFAEFNNSGISNFIEQITKTNELQRSLGHQTLSDSLAKYFEPISNPFAEFNKSGISVFLDQINKANELQRSLMRQTISDTIANFSVPKVPTVDLRITNDLISSLRSIPDFKLPNSWEDKELQDIYEEISSESDEDKKNENFFSYFALVCILITGIDISDLKNPDKRNLVWAQILRMLFIFAITQYGNNGVEEIHNICVSKRGCVVRSGPSFKSKRISAVPKDYMFRVLEDDGEWYKVQYIDIHLGFRDGWIKKSVTSNNHVSSEVP